MPAPSVSDFQYLTQTTHLVDGQGQGQVVPAATAVHTAASSYLRCDCMQAEPPLATKLSALADALCVPAKAKAMRCTVGQSMT